jgi:methenyltetrahydrofolate cyclohydrolase
MEMKELPAHLGLEQFLDSLASANPLPGGGSAAALSGAMAAALVGMVCRVTLKSMDIQTSSLHAIANRADERRAELIMLIELDGDAYRGVMQAYKLKQPETLQTALIYATKIPLRTATLCAEILSFANSVMPIARPSAKSDLAVGALVAQAGLRGAIVTANTNLREIRDEGWIRSQREYISQMLVAAEQNLRRVMGE